MKYTVIATKEADRQLTEIWLRAHIPQDVTDASDRIQIMLRDDPSSVGESRPDGRRVVILPPLTVAFEISDDDRKVTIVSHRYRP